MKDNNLNTLKNGIFKNNPVFRLVLGTCPTLAVTTSCINGLSMGLATTFVLIFSNIMISMLRKIIPDKIRIPVYVLIIATFVTIIQMLLAKYLPSINESLGLFIPLIVVNCIILGRAEAFASSNAPIKSAMDGIGIGLGFTLSLLLMGFVRELLGAGSIFGKPIDFLQNSAMTIFILPAGGFFVFGFLMVAFNNIYKRVEKKKNSQKENV